MNREKAFFGFGIPIYLIKICFKHMFVRNIKLNKNFVVSFKKPLLFDRNNIIIWSNIFQSNNILIISLQWNTNNETNLFIWKW